MIVVHRQADLLQVVDALHPAGRLAGRLHGRQQQGDQDGDDGDHHQQLDQGKTTTRDVSHDPLRPAIRKTVTKCFVTEVVARSGRLGTACLHERLSRNGRTVSPGP